jgi:hypothetical protein
MAEPRLRLRIANTRPVELQTLTRSLAGVDRRFRGFLADNKLDEDGDDLRLYVERIRPGSIILDLAPLAQQASLVANHLDSILQFAHYLKYVFDFFTGKQDGDVPTITKNDMSQISDTLEVVANDNGSNLFITVNNGSAQIFNVKVTSTEANAIQNQIRRKLNPIPDEADDVYRKETMVLYQARGGAFGAKIGHKAIIERFSPKPLKLLFDNQDAEAGILHTPENPFERVYIVDVRVGTINGEPTNYKVIRVHESYERS